MDWKAASIVAGVAVGLAFVAAGAFKLSDGDGWRRQAADMGVRRRIAVVVPWVEIVIGSLTAVHIVAPLPAIALLGMLIVFTIVIVLRLLDGSRPPCACFGRRSRRPLGAYHVLRNLVLGALTVVAIVGA